MSVLFTNNELCLIDHRDYILNIYQDVTLNDNITKSYALSTNLFSIKKSVKVNRKRNHDSDDIHEEALRIKEKYGRLLKEIPSCIKKKISNKYNILDTAMVCNISRHFFETTIFDHNGIQGGNNAENPIKCIIKNECFLIPQKSRFFCGCVKQQCEKLSGSKFDIVVADPPWWNKYIRRLKSANNKLSYSMMYNEDIASIPLKELLAANCLVAVWCTNAPSNVAAVKNTIFPSWGVEYITTWYWLKVTTDLEPMCEFGTGCKKQPYERLILGKVGEVGAIPDCQLFMSLPSALHSHKPPLLDLLSPYVNVENPEVLELFARYLLPNTTSVGYEPLKWQHISLYEAT